MWVLLTAWRPTTTFHLGPAVVAVAYPYLRQTSVETRRSRPAAVVDALIRGLVPAVLLVALDTAGRLRGPALFGGGPVREGLILRVVVAAATLLGVVGRNRRGAA